MANARRQFQYILAFLVVFGPVQTMAGIFDELLMPGPVIEAHSSIEKRCETCHAKLEKRRQNQLCLDCHDHSDIEDDIRKNHGFHGRNPAVQDTLCSHCHSEHLGRDARVVLFNPEAFGHDHTDFELLGKHRDVECAECHAKSRKYSAAPNLCIDCHEDDDPHQGRLGRKCQDCHNADSWRKSAFDHDRDTKFKLEGKHSEVGCKLCHAGERYERTPKDCVACHRINDAHNGNYGRKCHKCHNNEEWKESTFDHAKCTKFKLIGRHANTSCGSCHKKKLFDEKPASDCFSCHRLDDEHKGENGKSCQNCHDSKQWSNVRFSHDKDTKFPLTGTHKGLACEACHKGSPGNRKKQKSDCIECHRDDDVHNEQEGADCKKCHNEDGWGKRVFFDHDLTRFPLIGQHGIVPCEECHLSSAYQDTEHRCFACHQKDDVHEEAFTQQCHRCHSPNSWGIWFFDHSEQTEFALEGKHEGLSCDACHTAPVPDGEELDQACIACHEYDDRHRGEFGWQCDKCHTSSSFADVKYPR